MGAVASKINNLSFPLGLKFLVRLCQDLGLKEATDYGLELKKAEKAKEVRARLGSSGRPETRRSSGRSSSKGYVSDERADSEELGELFYLFIYRRDLRIKVLALSYVLKLCSCTEDICGSKLTKISIQ